MQKIDCAIIGAGVVGLAVARALALSGRDVIVLERNYAIGMESSSRNSEVIHAGLYYAVGSLKARLCIEGKQLLYSYCKEHGIEARAIGKLLAATQDNQIPKLHEIKNKAEQNGLTDLAWLTQEEAQAMEPHLYCVKAFFSPSSGIIDSHSLMLSLQGDLEDAGGVIAFGSTVERAQTSHERVEIEVSGERLSAKLVVNCAGIYAPELAHAMGVAKSHAPKTYLAKGNYFSLSGVSAPFKHLVYPMPNEAGLGIHVTVDLAGAVRFGPDVEWIETIDYTVDKGRQKSFEMAIREYWPALPDHALIPAYSGIRAKIVGPGESAADFTIQGPSQHGIAGLWNLFGIESPGLTACLALANELQTRLNQ